MRSMYAIYRKEMGHYFVSPVAYVIGGFFLFLSGFLFRSVRERRQTSRAPDAPTWVLRAFLGFLALVFLFFLPMLTMGVYAEERKRGTMELLMTSPITELQIVLGKFLASLTLFAAMLLPDRGLRRFHVDPQRARPALAHGALRIFGNVAVRRVACWRWDRFFRRSPRIRLSPRCSPLPRFWLFWAIDFGSSAAPAVRQGRFCNISQ